MNEPIVSTKISAGQVMVAVACLTLFLQQWGIHDQDVKAEADRTIALATLGQRVGDIAERLQALNQGSTQRFTSLDDAIGQVSKHVDAIQTSVQNINDRLVIQEAKTQALQDEIKTVIAAKK